MRKADLAVDVLARGSPTVTTVVFVVLMVVAAVLDLKSRRIPNALTVAGIVAGLVFEPRSAWMPWVVACWVLASDCCSAPRCSRWAHWVAETSSCWRGWAPSWGPRQLAAACLLIALLGEYWPSPRRSAAAPCALCC